MHHSLDLRNRADSSDLLRGCFRVNFEENLEIKDSFSAESSSRFPESNLQPIEVFRVDARFKFHKVFTWRAGTCRKTAVMPWCLDITSDKLTCKHYDSGLP